MKEADSVVSQSQPVVVSLHKKDKSVNTQFDHYSFLFKRFNIRSLVRGIVSSKLSLGHGVIRESPALHSTGDQNITNNGPPVTLRCVFSYGLN